ncbi:helix-turn-helix domain containing protein [Leifsonia sp. H3M29-4]|jgi:AcrR family transcriptional regulator|uniref:TetR/AcrR family transcriptional regulator n=1 Tax=Microbacteriaceae TaxID=85023 RepID=UPI000962FCAA|nr:TetR/AcrR family transcriptional regulator [Salinibacterium metalliresistens]MAT83261.1 TetR family transcriptional regulator [Gammaproteobacteria bacterium]MBN9139228.1 TetR/AcrR family transcriptional regulator [Micrococcales bacterium]MCB1297523.1 TetR/AcrR family transcriptional regulator [Microthrixaceae bacterium]OJX66852.1 MAG: TetR family transcriptional regulator [Micrococcales bacterium 72-143]MDF1477895.1 helix-turn-helix domain containing protein [Salinibacterium metalliresisten
MDGSTMRVDAAASMAKILGAARRAFSLGDGSGTLNRIAKEAGVGIATLYRHFPNRESLALAVYDDVFATEVQPVFAQFERTDAPRDVLLELGERLLGVLDRERGLVRSLSNLAEATRELMGRNAAAIEQTVRRAQAAGTLRADITPEDIPNLMTMIAAGFGSIPSGAHRRRYLSLVLDSLNPAQAHPLPSV